MNEPTGIQCLLSAQHTGRYREQYKHPLYLNPFLSLLMTAVDNTTWGHLKKKTISDQGGFQSEGLWEDTERCLPPSSTGARWSERWKKGLKGGCGCGCTKRGERKRRREIRLTARKLGLILCVALCSHLILSFTPSYWNYLCSICSQ